MVAQKKLAQGAYAKTGGGIQGFGMQGGNQGVMNANGVPQGSGVPIDQSTGIDITTLKKTMPCHICNKVDHWTRECRSNPNQLVLENQIPDIMHPQNNRMQYPHNVNTGEESDSPAKSASVCHAPISDEKRTPRSRE